MRAPLATAILMALGAALPALAAEPTPPAQGRSGAPPAAGAPAQDGRFSPRLPGPPRIGTRLAGTRWRAQVLVGRQAPAGSALTLEFLEDGFVRGETGCNRFVGPYATRADHVVIGPLDLTRRDCQAGAAKLESAYVAALEGVERMELQQEDQILIVHSARAEKPSRFLRQP